MKNSVMLQLLLTFMKIGFFTFGGGYAMISMIEDICVNQKGWLTHDEMIHVTIVAESTPGPIAINCATYIGYKQSRFSGAVIATLGMVLPSFLVILVISKFLDNFLEIEVIANAFNGIKVAVGILIVNAAFNMIRKMKKQLLPKIIMVSSAVTMLCINIFAWNFSSISLMLVAALIGIVSYLINRQHSSGLGE
ncbi:MAG TPA: chromate transporter [Clostridiaceae bacterium]|nr:chromate transporter [Clostridiaceae bacterium]